MDEADIVIVGGGSGGSAVASRLSETPGRRVALLEAGGRNTGIKTLMPGMIAFQGPRTNWGFDTVPQPGLNGRQGNQPRGRGLGGSSAINAMLYIRGHPWDYDHWASLGCDGWAWDQVLPVFKRAECNVRGADDWHGADGPLHVSEQVNPHPGSLAFIESAGALQIPHNPDFNGASQDGAGLYQVTQNGGERWSAARAYLEPARNRANLNVLTDTIAEKILFENGRAIGVQYRRGGRSRFIRARAGVVAAGGVFGTPQLLMLSGIGPAAHLAAHGINVHVDRPMVGDNLQDHLDFTLSYESHDPSFMGRTLKGQLAGLKAIGQWMLHRRGTMTSPYAEAGAFIRTAPDLPAPDIQLHFLIAIVEDHGRAKVKPHGFSCHACVLRPKSRGTMRLRSSDPLAAPLIDPRFLSEREDLDVMMKGVRMMARIMETPPIADLASVERHAFDHDDDTQLEAAIRARSDTIYHPVGTARMGSDPDAVCDPRLKVRGVDGLWIADASIMPTLIGGNTNAPSIMIGERCADFIRAELG